MISNESSDDSETNPVADSNRTERLLLLFSVFVVGGCGLLYELINGAVASYLVGDTITQYSLVIGFFLAAMGAGAWVTQWIRSDLLDWFIAIQLVIAIVGGFSTLILFAAFAMLGDITPIVLAVTGACGLLAGMEIPLVLRIFKGEQSLRTSVAHVLTLDYLGALAASIAFPFLMLPLLSLTRSALATGTFNALVAVLGTMFFWKSLKAKKQILILQIATWSLLVFGWIYSGSMTSLLEDRLYPNEIVYAETTKYQRIVLTHRSGNDDVRLHLEGHLQFSSKDEHRYHESLVLPALESIQAPTRVLVLGGGDGLAIRTLLDSEKGKSIELVDLVDLDDRVVDLFKNNQSLAKLNGAVLKDPRVNTIHQDAFSFLRDCRSRYDLIISDLPDPSNIRINKLYSDAFFVMALANLEPGGAFVTQATSPWYARNAFWCIHQTIESAATSSTHLRKTVPYHVEVPSFGGDWGFVMAIPNDVNLSELSFDSTNRFLTREAFQSSIKFPKDTSRIDPGVNKLLDPILVRLHRSDWGSWYD